MSKNSIRTKNEIMRAPPFWSIYDVLSRESLPMKIFKIAEKTFPYFPKDSDLE